MRLTSVDEAQLKKTIKHSIWGSRMRTLSYWEEGDIIVFLVNKEIAAVAKVTGSLFVSDTPIWDNGLFPYRIPIKFIKTFKPEERIPVQGTIKDALYKFYGPKYGYVILNKRLLNPYTADTIWKAVNK